MKRDMDLIRAILLAIEGQEALNAYTHVVFQPDDLPGPCPSEGALSYHMTLLIESGLVRGKVSHKPIVTGLTMPGHDFLDSIRDPALWEKTKEAANEAGGFTLELLGIKTQIERHTGVQL